jgi:sodium/hydrogen antiporter
VGTWASVILAICVLGFALLSRRLALSGVSSFMVFVTLGLVLGPSAVGIVDVEREVETITPILELALTLVLFTDAASIQLSDLRREDFLPGRLLLVGLPLTMLFGLGLASPLFPALGIWELALIAIILAPTDAALGLPAITDERVPPLVRHGLNVESGLNDGIALPFFTIVLALAQGAEANEPREIVLRALVLTPVLAAGVGWLAGSLLVKAQRRGWVDRSWSQILALATALGAYALALAVDGSGFIAAWVAGLTFGAASREARAAGLFEVEPAELTEVLGALLATVSFFLFGVVMLGPVLGQLTWQTVVYAVLSLTAVRMVPVAISLMRTGLAAPTVGYVGWFGPRGLASVVLGLIVLESGLENVDTLAAVIVVTVLLSVFAHGASARWLAGRYGAWFDRARTSEPQLREATAAAPARRRRVARLR